MKHSIFDLSLHKLKTDVSFVLSIILNVIIGTGNLVMFCIMFLLSLWWEYYFVNNDVV